jgi:hypothetical protein
MHLTLTHARTNTLKQHIWGSAFFGRKGIKHSGGLGIGTAPHQLLRMFSSC